MKCIADDCSDSSSLFRGERISILSTGSERANDVGGGIRL
jgi:hypothetical protein